MIRRLQVQALCTLDNGTIVTGSDDGMLKIWYHVGAVRPTPRGIAHNRRSSIAFTPACFPPQAYGDPIIVPFPKGIRTVSPIAPCPAFADGGIAVGCLDGLVYLCWLDGTVVRTCSGHTSRVVDLSWTCRLAMF